MTPKKSTVADLWLETYAHMTEIEIKKPGVLPDPKTGKYPTRPWQGFVNLSPLMKHPEFLKDLSKIYAPTVSQSKRKIVEIDGFPYAMVKPTYLISIGLMGDSYRGIYNKLLQRFSVECIHLCWPDIELHNRNAQALKQNRRERHDFLTELKKVPKQDRQLHAEVLHVTSNRSAGNICKERRGFQLQRKGRTK